MNCRYW